MRIFRFELLLAAALILVCAAVWRWQAPSDPMTPGELTRYLDIIDRQLPLAAAEKADDLARLRAFGENDDGRPAYMLNLMRYNDVLRADAGIPAGFHGTPAEANALYEKNILPLALASGALPVFLGNVHERNVTSSSEDEENWDRVGVIRYPSRRAFFELLSDPAYAKIAPYKLGALHVALVPSDSEVVLPDLRLATLAAAIIGFLAAGWIRAAGIGSRRDRAVAGPAGTHGADHAVN